MTLSDFPDFQIDSNLDSLQQIRMLRLLQWQLQHLLSFESTGTAGVNGSEAFEVKMRSPVLIKQDSHLKPGILIQKNSRHIAIKKASTRAPTNSSVVWVFDVIERSIERECARLYAQANIADCWLLDLNKAELHLYQQPSQLGYVSYRVLQVGDRAVPDAVPINAVLQEPTPLHFMIRTLNGQQTYRSYTLPFTFSRKLL